MLSTHMYAKLVPYQQRVGIVAFPKFPQNCIFVHVTLFCMRNSGLIKFRHGTTFTEINDAVDDGPVCRTLDGRLWCCYTLRRKLHRFDLSLYLLQTGMYNILTTN